MATGTKSMAALVQGGSLVRVQDDDGEHEFAIVEPHEADASAGRVSIESPLGRAVLGHGVGECVLVRAPAGGRSVRIVAIEAAEAGR
jgi:transcription elongation factor GreA